MLRERRIRNKQGDTRAFVARAGVLVMIGVVLLGPALLGDLPAEERFRIATVRLKESPDLVAIAPSRLADLITRLAAPWLQRQIWAWGLLAALSLCVATRGLVRLAGRVLVDRTASGSRPGFRVPIGPGLLVAASFFVVVAGTTGANSPRATAEFLILGSAIGLSACLLGRRQSSPVVLVAIGVGLTLVAATLDGGFAPRGLGPAFLDLLVPLPRSLPLDAGRGLALAASFLTAIGGLVVGGLIVGSAAQRTRIVSLALAALALSMAFPQAYALSAAWLALTLAASAMALRHPGPREVMTGALLVFLAYTSVNAARERLHALKSHEHELGVIQAQLDNLPDDLDDLLLLGVPDHHGYRAALIADTSHPFSATPRRLRVAHEGHWERLGDDLLDGGDRRLILEWGPINLLTAGQRPEGWRLVPRLRGSNSVGDDSGIRLLEPTNGIRIPVAAPRRLDEDLAFVFEIAAPPAPATLPALVFYGFHEVAFGPKSREFGVRRLEPAVLEELEGSPGWRRLRWRTSVRPGPGEDGLAFDDPDRGLAGHSFWWTVGRIDQATIPDEAVTPFPESVAPTQRIWFSPTKDR